MKNPTIKIKNFGIYSQWNNQINQKELPNLIKFTDQIPAILQIEFGYILHIIKGKGLKIDFCIEHPPFLNNEGQIAPPFTGETYINSNDYYFFLGDTLWAPIQDKVGPWVLKCFIEGKIIAEKTLMISEQYNSQFLETQS